MASFTPTERRTLSLAVALLALGTAGRVWLAPGAAEFAWQPSSSPRPAESIGEVRRAVDDTLRRAAEAERPLAPGERIDVNRAGVVQLQRLPGVGPARAAAIVHERATNGPFLSAEGLDRVSGVGPRLIQQWADLVEISGVRAPPRGAATAASSRLDLNRAHLKELEQITGVGPVLARRILDERARRGGFASIDELLEVPGIGPKTLNILREQAYVP